MRKKFAQLTKELNDGKDELRALREKEKEMNDLMRGLEKDILVCEHSCDGSLLL